MQILNSVSPPCQYALLPPCTRTRNIEFPDDMMLCRLGVDNVCQIWNVCSGFNFN